MIQDDERLARVALSRLVEPDENGRLGRLLQSHTAVELLADLKAGLLADESAPHWSARLAALDVAADLRRAERCGARVVCPGDEEWPVALDNLGDARPVALWVCGGMAFDKLVDRSVAVVGARACTTYGQSVAMDIAASLSEHDWTIVSGGAFGIDAAAHRGALAVSGQTVAVLACGIDRRYPPGNARLLDRIAEEGLLVSELPPGVSPTRGRFIVRNRLIAALARGTVVVEAAARSGALSTLRRAADLGRPAMGVPGPITSAMSVGVHKAIRQHVAEVVTSAAEVIEMVGRIGTDMAPIPTGEVRPTDGLDPQRVRVLEAIPPRVAVEASELAVRAGLAPGTVLVALGELLAAGLVERVDGGWRLARKRPDRDSSSV